MPWVDFPNKEVHEFSEYFSSSGWPNIEFRLMSIQKNTEAKAVG